MRPDGRPAVGDPLPERSVGGDEVGILRLRQRQIDAVVDRLIQLAAQLLLRWRDR
jgi:hypothetical protein